MRRCRWDKIRDGRIDGVGSEEDSDKFGTSLVRMADAESLTIIG